MKIRQAAFTTGTPEVDRRWRSIVGGAAAAVVLSSGLLGCGGGSGGGFSFDFGPGPGNPAPPPAPAPAPAPVASADAEIQARAASLVAQMTLDEKIQMLRSDQQEAMEEGPEGGAGHVPGIPRLGIPDLFVVDSATGSGSAKLRSTSFPASIALAATWDGKAVHDAGAAIAKQLHEQGFNMGLGGGVNMVRDPRNGRTMEYMGEDPVLSGELLAHRTNGTQSMKVIASGKHMVGNEQERARNSGASHIDERTLRQIYMLPYEIALKTSSPGSVMCSYNKLRLDGDTSDTYACEHPHLLTDILKTEWQFKGMVQSDWNATHSTVAAINAGLDDEQHYLPTIYFKPTAVKIALVDEQIKLSRLDDMVKRKLFAMIKAGVMDDTTRFNPRAMPFGVRFEAEIANLFGGTLLAKDHLGATGSGFVAGISAVGARISSNLAGIPSDGSYLLQVRYANSTSGTNTMTVKVDGAVVGRLSFAKLANWDTWGVASLPLQLKPGNHAIDIVYAQGDSGSVNIDNFAVTAADASYPPATPLAPGVVDFEAAALASQQTAEQGIVLLKNAARQAPLDGSNGQAVLPLDVASVKKIAVIGPQVDKAILAGGGSADTRMPAWGVIPTCGDLTYFNNPGCSWWLKPWKLVRTSIVQAIQEAAPGATVTRGGHSDQDNPFRSYTENEIADAVAQATNSDVAVVVALQVAGEDGDLKTLGLNNASVKNQDEMISRVAAANKNTVVVLVNGNPVLMPWIDKVASVVEAWYPGENGGPALANVLFGKVNPSGKLPLTFPVSDTQTPTGGKPFVDSPVYTEKLNVGYRWYDAFKETPLFEFGHGLSYTTFAYSDLKVDSSPDGSKTVNFKLTNTGKVEGKEVAQVYMSFPSRTDEPPKRLVGWQKVNLKPGESQAVTVAIPRERQNYWNTDSKGWVMMNDGAVMVGASSRDIRLQ